MGPKKKDDIVDISTLPKINIAVTSILLHFNNNDRRMKILENFYKTPHKIIRFISREQIIEYAKEQKIFVEPVENKKDPNPQEKREINSDELAKAASGMIVERSIPVMKDKKALMEKIEELKKQKEEATIIWNNPPPEDPKKKLKPGEKKKEPINPDDIIIPVIDELGTELSIVFYNYPLDAKEYNALSSNEKVILNYVEYVNETDELVEEHKEEIIDPKTKKVTAPKEVKPTNEILLMQKYFAIHNLAKDPLLVFNNLLNSKLNSDKNSSLRNTYFNKTSFSYKSFEEGGVKKDSISIFQDEFVNNISQINKNYLHYLRWIAKTHFQKMMKDYSSNKQNDFEFTDIKIDYTPNHLISMYKEVNLDKKDFEHISVGALLFTFCCDLIKNYRINNEILENNEMIYDKTDIDGIFDKIEKDIDYEFGSMMKNAQIANIINESSESKREKYERDVKTNQENNNTYNVYSSHLYTDMIRETEKLEKEMTQTDELSTPFKLIIDEKDFILRSTLENKIDNVNLFEKEKVLNLFRQFPGITRYLMPEIAPKEENFRKAKKCEIYPFLENGISIPIYEKFEIVRKFEEIFREKLPEQNFDFGNRIYQEVMNRDILTQTLNTALLYDTEQFAFYNERDDNILFATYYRSPKGRVYRKTNIYRYLSKPDFENWVKFFRPTFKELNSNESIDKVKTPMKDDLGAIRKKSLMPSSMSIPAISTPIPHESPGPKNNNKEIYFNYPNYDINHLLYEVDDTCVGEVTERIKYMFPTDNGVFIRKIIENGIFSSHSNYVVKDNLVFGIRKEKNITEFWLRFENDVLLTVNYLGNYDSLLKIHDEQKYDTENGTYSNISFKNGLNVQILPNGEICQKIIHHGDDKNVNDELYRIIASKASVIKYDRSDKTTIMYANGNVCSLVNGLSVNTNNKGLRIARKINDKTEYEMDPIPITIQTDPESNTKTLIRDDKVMNIKYLDKSSLTIHADDTKIYTYKDNCKYLIEHDNYSSVEIRVDPVKKRTKTIISEGSSDALLGHDDIMIRSYDGYLSKIILPDKTIVYTYKEKKATEDVELFTFNTVTIIYRVDGTVIRIQQDGDIVIISSEERIKFNSKGQNRDFMKGEDVDYLFELNGKAGDRRGGVYTADVVKSKIWTKDDENNIFEIHADNQGTAKCKLAVSLDIENSQKTIDEIIPDSPRYETNDYIDPNCMHLEAPKNFLHPRLFVIENDNTGYELINEDQLSNFKIIKSKDIIHTRYFSHELEDHFISHNWITKHRSISELISETHYINNIKLPKKLEKVTQTPVNLKFPPKEIYLYRNIIESQPFDKEFRDKVELSLISRDNWFNKRKLEFGVYQIKSENDPHIKEIEENNQIQRRILMERQNPDLKFDYDSLKNNISSLVHSDFININENDSVLFDIEEHVKVKESKKIIEDRKFRVLPLDLKLVKTEALTNTINIEMMSSKGSKTKRTMMVEVKAAAQEFKFVDNFYSTDMGKSISQMYPRVAYKPKKKKEDRDDIRQKNKQNLNNLGENENDLNSNPYNLDDNINNKLINPIVYLEDEKRDNEFAKTEKAKKLKRKMLPSIYKQKLNIMKEKSEKEKIDSELWQKLKKYEFNHDAVSLRKDNPLVPKYLKTTFPEAEFNEDYIYVEKMTDKRLKTSSVANRIYFNAPSISDIRKNGQHNFLIDALEKKKTYDEMMERLNLMITSELCDPLNKMLKVEPIQLDFGFIKVGYKYQMYIKIRNDDNMTNRVQVRKNIDNKFINIELFIGGKITPGETKKVKIIIEPILSHIGKFKEEIQIQTKTFIYKIPVHAVIMTEEEFIKLDEESKRSFGKGLMSNAQLYKKEVFYYYKISFRLVKKMKNLNLNL